jgi:hypothetical protein
MAPYTLRRRNHFVLELRTGLVQLLSGQVLVLGFIAERKSSWGFFQKQKKPTWSSYVVTSHLQQQRECTTIANQIFPIYNEIQNGAVAKSYMTNGLLIYGYMGKYLHTSSYIRKPFLIYDFATAPL